MEQMIPEVEMRIWHTGNDLGSFPKVVQQVTLTGGNGTKGDSLGTAVLSYTKKIKHKCSVQFVQLGWDQT